jgi:transcriptional regulator with XRE-family HTH domain
MRERHGLSQTQLAYRAASTQQGISRIERGLVSPSVEMLDRLAAACGEQLHLDFQPRAVPFDDHQLAASARRSLAERLELADGWNEFAGEIAIAGAKAREQR